MLLQNAVAAVLAQGASNSIQGTGSFAHVIAQKPHMLNEIF